MYPYGNWYRSFLEGLSSLLRAGVPVREALEALAAGAPGGRVGRLAHVLALRVSEGSTLGEAMGAAWRWVPPEHAAVLEAGERAGALDDAIARVIELHGSRVRTASEFLRSLAWPLVSTVAASTLLPAYLLVSDGRGTYLAIQCIVFGSLGLAALVFAVGFPRRLADSRFGGALERLVLAIPFAGRLLRERAVARFLGVLAFVLRAGVSLEEAFGLAEKTLGWGELRVAAAGIPAALRKGSRFHEALSAASAFRLRAEAVAAIYAGEVAGQLDGALLEVSEHLEEAVRLRTRRVLSAVPALLVLAIGAAVACRLFSIYAKVWQLD